MRRNSRLIGTNIATGGAHRATTVLDLYHSRDTIFIYNLWCLFPQQVGCWSQHIKVSDVWAHGYWPIGLDVIWHHAVYTLFSSLKTTLKKIHT